MTVLLRNAPMPLIKTLPLFVLLCAAGVQAQTLEATSNIVVRALDRSVDFTSDTTTSIRDMKEVAAARDEAAAFVASGGAQRHARLEAALRELRERVPQARKADDLALAEAILAL